MVIDGAYGRRNQPYKRVWLAEFLELIELDSEGGCPVFIGGIVRLHEISTKSRQSCGSWREIDRIELIPCRRKGMTHGVHLSATPGERKGGVWWPLILSEIGQSTLPHASYGFGS